MVAETKGTRMNTKALAVAASLWVPMVASAATEASVTDRQEALSGQLEQILSKAGISIGGQFRGEIGASVLGGNARNLGRRDDEQIGFTSVDFDLRARPNSFTTARVVFREHLDYSNFFGTPYAPFETRWLSLDGTAADMLYYHLGSMNLKWAPLTMRSSVPGFMYTPRIFAQKQAQTMAERFINEGRNLQGLNLGLRAAVPPAQIDSFDVSLLAAKLLSAAPAGSPKSIFVSNKNFSGDGTVGYPDTLANFDRWALGAKGSVTFLKGVSLEGNFMQTKDLRSTYGTIDTASTITKRQYQKPTGDTIIWAGKPAMQTRDSIIQNGNVIEGALGIKVANVIGNQNLIADLDVDVARSAWDYYSGREIINPVVTLDTLKTGGTFPGTKTVGRFSPIYETKTGLALNVGLTGGWKSEVWTVKAKVGYLMNDSTFRSDLAQTPVFDRRFGRVMNSEQDVNALIRYNTFDALYHNVHRWVAEEPNEYAKNPYDKIAYSNYVGGAISPSLGNWTASTSNAYKRYLIAMDSVSVASARYATSGSSADSTRLATANKNFKSSTDSVYTNALYGTIWDRDLQLVLPGGEASANRVGPKFGLDFDLMQGGVEVKVDGYMLQEAKGTILDSAKQLVAEKAKFQQIQAGARVRADRFISGWDKPIELSGSVGLSTAKGGAALNYQSTVINAGLYAGVIKRLAVLGGYQLIDGKDKAFFVDRKQSNMAAGLEFKVQEGAYLLGMYNLVKTEFPNATQYNFDQTIWSTKISVSF